ncbi:Uncharacterised protein [Legionella pneumophila]|nr:Uncharacterised protein [Legionella pneumophila]
MHKQNGSGDASQIFREESNLFFLRARYHPN